MNIQHPMKYFPLLFLLWANVANAQFYVPVYADLTGQELLDSVKSAYKANFLLPEGPARDTLFSVVYGQNDSLTCVYSGYTIWLDPNKDPTQAAFDFDINTEHTFPKSYFGDTGPGLGDMHHLYATRADVNNARGNSPFVEIPDNQTEEWYYLDTKLTSVPTSNIDLYSERKGLLFEPREDHKGNVARAMFYFYTMYKDQVDAIDPAFFESQRATFCAWHLLDPADQQEWGRTWLIANYQDGKPNPFVLDCTLPERCYCAEYGQACSPPPSTATNTVADFSVQPVKPNPFSYGTYFTYALLKPGIVRLEILNLAGQAVDRLDLGKQEAGEHTSFWEPKPGTGAGLYLYKLMVIFENGQVVAPGKMLLIP